jgi:ComF family protein
MWSKFTQLLLPTTDCVACNYLKSQKQGFCTGCYHDLPHIQQSCLRCGLPVSADNQCACQAEDWPFSICLAACAYAFPVDALISQFKNQHKLSLSNTLGQLIVSQIQRQRLTLPELLIPVPAHADRLKQRGFNQAQEIANTVGAMLSIPVEGLAIQRGKLLTGQKKSGRQQRTLNVDNAFSLTKSITAKRVALIDDVITTGATTKAIAYLLREHGVADIQSWAVARTF